MNAKLIRTWQMGEFSTLLFLRNQGYAMGKNSPLKFAMYEFSQWVFFNIQSYAKKFAASYEKFVHLSAPIQEDLIM